MNKQVLKYAVICFAAIGLIVVAEKSWTAFQDSGKVYVVTKSEWYSDGETTPMDVIIDGGGALYAARWQVTLKQERGSSLRTLTIRDGQMKGNPVYEGDRVIIGLLGSLQRL